MKILARIALLAALILITITGPVSRTQAQESRDKQESGGVITGRVTVAGKPARAIAVAARLQEINQQSAPVAKATTDEAGNYRLTGVPAGRYYVTTTAPAYLLPMDSLTFQTHQRFDSTSQANRYGEERGRSRSDSCF